jgi:predicted NUDIX family NTP pyrophosphohydrolase
VPKLSAGLLLYRFVEDNLEVLIGHPGGPFWARKDDGAWSIPKGEYTEGEDPWTVAQREFEEELGKKAPAGPRMDFAPKLLKGQRPLLDGLLAALEGDEPDVSR